MKRQKAFKGFRLHIGLFGRRNVGKSSLLNAITRQSVSIVSDTAGTTTDPVEKTMEFLPLGPVVFIDTAGIDDVGALGGMRVEKSKRIIKRTNLGVVITEGELTSFELELLSTFKQMKIPHIVVFNKSDISPVSENAIAQLKKENIPHVSTCATTKNGISDFRQLLIDKAPADFVGSVPIIKDLVSPGETAVLVIPIDKEAPKGRIILPQVQTMRELLDNDSVTIVVKENELQQALDNMKTPPKIVVTDSQAFNEISKIVPDDILLTGFSVLFARFKGDLPTQVKGAKAIDKLIPGDKVLIAESCSHHPIEEDIGRVKIPAWLNKFVGGDLDYTTVQGHDFPENLKEYKLVIHCGACMFNKRAMLSRLTEALDAGVPMTNYGLVIAHTAGILNRALKPFPEAEKYFKEE